MLSYIYGDTLFIRKAILQSAHGSFEAGLCAFFVLDISKNKIVHAFETYHV